MGLDLGQGDGVDDSERSTADGLPRYLQVRHTTASYIASNPEQFEPFIEEPLEEYLHKIRDTGEWGGQLELSALANAYGLKIHVLQGSGRVETIDPLAGEVGEKKVWLAYYRHGFGLGEHYNSLRKAP
jgi:OTU domain-containing protein 6